MLKTIKIIITGRVQGVFFRDFIKNKADALNIKGFNRNISDGSVEVIAQGDEKSLNKLVEQMKIGPEFAKINKIKVSIETIDDIFEDFEIRY